MDKIIQSAKSTVSQFSQSLFKQSEQHKKFVENEAKNSKHEENIPKVDINNNNDEIGTCYGGLDEEEINKLKAELDKAKEINQNNYSTRSRLIKCVQGQTATPVQLLHVEGQSGITYNENVVRNLFLDPQLKDRQVVVISIVGAFRKGKSFLMNYMLRYLYANYPTTKSKTLINPDCWLGDENEPLTGFTWRSGVERVTKGLILWGDVFLYDPPKGEKLAIYIMDTQGLFDHHATASDNSNIFSLSTLISSVQIMNIFNILQENQLQYLQFATEFARYASSDSETSPFQNLLILIRDWNSVDEYKYGLRGGNAYLNTFLEIQDFQSPELQSVRRYLRSSFDKIDCFLMPHPGKKVATDKTYDGRWKDIDSDFVDLMSEFFEYLFKKMKPKTINNAPIKPDELLIFINSYVESFKNGSIPAATTLYESTLEQQFRILIAKSVDIYIDSVAAHDSELQGEEDITKLHIDSKNKALKHFQSEKTFGSYSEGNNFKKQLVNKIEEIYKQWRSVSLTQIQKLQVQKQKTEQQIQQLKEAQNIDIKAKKDLEEANKKVNEAKVALENAKTDTEQARREAEELKIQLEEAEKQRAEAIEKEKQTKEWVDKISSDKDYFEQEYHKLKMQAMQNVGNVLVTQQGESGFERFLGQVSNVFTKVAPIVATISSWFG
ncbi:hypothetical protein PVAND_003185 [Polypedilum vanderplanki]|uniref:GB1/RHD3-type G domain-containing protein n=1 Tax=Polypedilum vanderplanki TaxID=319348 RepID=A0A9J6BTA0_POLVA|nr:hypothetical protein PVAND_003185 [Polypedilum vanderplanki]